jgi:hypothetical protein
VLTTILRLPHVACRESALHGLCHWTKRDRVKPVEIIDRFASETPGLRPELVTFCGYAREGKLT